MTCKRLLKAIVLPVLLLLWVGVSAQNIQVAGKVTDARNGAGLAGVTVQEKGTQNGTSTDAEGNFTLRVASNATLVFSSIGFTTKEMVIPATGGMLNVTLEGVASALNEVVVIGYGTAKKKDLTGSAVAVTSKDFQKGQITSPEQLIAGKVAGVSITNNGGAPGAGSRIRIRGAASLNASNDPLIVVDGVPLSNDGISGSANALASINPNDIESFNILKDASAAAIYGNRASNGVIIITTKKGKKGKPTFNFNTQLQVSNLAKQTEVLDANQFRTEVNAKGSAEQKALLTDYNTNWQDEIFQQAISSDNNLSVSGALKGIPFRASAGYLNQEGVLMTGRLERYTGAIRLSPMLFDNHLKIDLNLNGSISKSRFANEGAIGSAVSFDPTKPVYDPSSKYGGYFEWEDVPGTISTLAPKNPVGLLMQREDNGTVERSFGNAQFDYKFHFLPELRANLNLGYDVSKGYGTVYVPAEAASDYNRKGRNNEYKQENQNLLLNFYLNYAKDIKSINSRVDVMAGYEYQDFKTTNYSFWDFSADGSIAPGAQPPLFPYDIPQNTLISVFGRLNYTLANKYLLTATLRRDGSSRFAEENRWGSFPSFAFAWKASEENFLKNSKVVSDLKLRLGYGSTGQQNIGANYSYLSYFALSNNAAMYQFGSNYYNMYRPGAYDPNRKWETSTTSNIGIDFGFADNRITGSLDYYMKETKDLLAEVSIPAGTNFGNKLLTNIGSMENRGVEFSINVVPIKKKDMTWDLGFNITANETEITELVDDPTFPGYLTGGISGRTGSNIQINSVGYWPQSFYVYKQVYDKSTGLPIQDAFEDLNRDGIINVDDRNHYQHADPVMLFGFSTNFQYKNFNAGLVMRANVGNYMYNNVWSTKGNYNTILNFPNFLNNASSNLLTTRFTNFENELLSDYYVSNASFLRMDNINLGYNFGKVFNNKANLRLNANVQNAFVITKYEGVDPEIAGGIDNNFYPRPRVVVIGLNLDF